MQITENANKQITEITDEDINLIMQARKTLLFKGTLMQIWKSTYMFVFIWKYSPENFAFLILGNLELYTRKVCEMFVYKHTETIESVKN